MGHIGDLTQIKAIPVGAVYLHSPDFDGGSLQINSFIQGARLVLSAIEQIDDSGNEIVCGYQGVFEGVVHQSDFETNILPKMAEVRNAHVRKCQFDCTSKDMLKHDYNSPITFGASTMLAFKSEQNTGEGETAGTAEIVCTWKELKFEGPFPSTLIKVRIIMQIEDYDGMIQHNIRS